MTSGQIRNFYIKYLGVGAVALGGFVALLRAFPTIIRTFKTGFGQMFSKADVTENIPRTDQDIKMKWVVTGLAVVTLIILFLPGIDIRFSAWMSSIIFGFLFVVVAARIVGEIGSTNSPVSGMTIATLLVTSFILMGFGASGVTGMVTTLMVGTVVCIAICMSGDIAQDLKTGYLLGATPRTQQLTEFVGLIFPAAAMGFTIFILNDAFGFVQTEATPNPLLAPQANVMATVIEGAFGANLPWAPIFVGGMVALGVELLGIGSLPFAIGLYLPLSLSTPIFAGGILHYVIKRSRGGSSLVDKRHQRGILFASGLVAGDALIGVFVAGMVAFGSGYRVYFEEHEGLFHSLTGGMGPLVSSIAFVGLALFSWNYFRSKK